MKVWPLKAVAARFVLALAFLLPRLQRLLVATLPFDRELEPVRGVLELPIQVLDDEPFGVPATPRGEDDENEDDED